MAPGCYIKAIAENSDAVVYCTNLPAVQQSQTSGTKEKKGKQKGSVQNARLVESSLIQNRGRYLILPKNSEANGQVLQVKSRNPYSNKIYFVTSKEGLQEINTSNKEAV